MTGAVKLIRILLFKVIQHGGNYISYKRSLDALLSVLQIKYVKCTYRRAPMVDVSWVSTTTTCSLPSVASLNSS